MDPTTAKNFVDGLFAFAKSKATGPLAQLVLDEADHLIDTLIDQYLATLLTK